MPEGLWGEGKRGAPREEIVVERVPVKKSLDGRGESGEKPPAGDFPYLLVQMRQRSLRKKLSEILNEQDVDAALISMTPSDVLLMKTMEEEEDFRALAEKLARGLGPVTYHGDIEEGEDRHDIAAK